MKLKPTTFYAAFPDGLQLLDGHDFYVNDRHLVVHKTRPPYLEWDKTYKVSEFTLGFGIPISPTRVRVTATELAVEVMRNISDDKWGRAIAAATKRRKTLKIIGVAK